MAFYITRPSVTDGRTVYYHGDNHWDENPTGRKSFSTRDSATALFDNPDGKNGGFKTAVVVEA